MIRRQKDISKTERGIKLQMTLIQLRYAIAIAGENSFNEAARKLYVSQPSLSSSIRSLEDELGFEIFIRSKSGVTVTSKGAEFLGYARSVIEQADLLNARFITQKNIKKKFGISLQHYTFAVNAFIELVRLYGMDEYEFEIYETKTYEVIDNVRNRISELGILYLYDFNRKVLEKMFSEFGLQFTPLFDCGIYVYMWKGHALAQRREVTLQDLADYPCLGFAQGEYNSLYFTEEVLSYYEYKQFIRVNDRATMLNLMIGLNGYTLCSGIICEDLNGEEYCAVKLKTDEKMTIGYISRKDAPVSPIGQQYLGLLARYKDEAMA